MDKIENNNHKKDEILLDLQKVDRAKMLPDI